MAGARQTAARIGAILALLVAVVFTQNVATSIAPSGTSAQTGRLVGRAGFAYLSGIRTFMAAVLWNRLEPQFHGYYADRPLSEQIQMLPTIRLVQTLDPQFVQSYYVACWVLARHGATGQGLLEAREGVKNNPSSGLLRSSLIQVMLLEDKDKYLPEEVAQADAGTAPGTAWTNDDDKLEGYAVFSTVYHLAGQTAKEKAAQVVVKALAAEPSSASDAGDESDGE